MSPDMHAADATVALRELIGGARVTHAIFAAARLGIADLLRDGPRTTGDLASAAGADADALRRLLRALAGLGIFAVAPGGRWALTPMGEALRSDARGSLHAFAIMSGERWVLRSWGAIEHSLRTGQPAFEHVFGAPLFAYYESHPEAQRVSTEALRSLSVLDDAAILAACDDLPERGTVVDVGGGQGSLLAAILVARPGLRGVLLEREPVVALARRGPLGAPQAAGRCALVVGDFFEAVPAGADRYVLKKVLHDWGDADARRILRACRAAIPDDGRLLLGELVVPEDGAPSQAAWLDLLMLVYTGGRERTAEEHRALLASESFALERVVTTTAPVSLIVARPC